MNYTKKIHPTDTTESTMENSGYDRSIWLVYFPLLSREKDLYMNEFDMCLVRRRGYVVDRAYTSFVVPCNNNKNNNHNRLLVSYTHIFIYICICHLTISSMVRFRCLNI